MRCRFLWTVVCIVGSCVVDSCIYFLCFRFLLNVLCVLACCGLCYLF